MNNSDFIVEINKLRIEKNAVILAHYYQIPEIQDIADFVGDSLELARKAKDSKYDIIVFAGVHFMAETAKILNPYKKVLIPDMEAGCSLADSCKAEDFGAFKSRYPDAIVVSYINCSADIKAMSDIICTSSNAIKVVNSIPKDRRIIFAPDVNLGNYVANVTNRELILWEGSCIVHEAYKLESIINLKLNYPDAKLIAHPECKTPILEISDFVGSTSALLKYVKENESNEFIVVTESGIIHQMKKNSPEKIFYNPYSDESCNCNDCKYMKMNTIEKIYNCLKNESPELLLSSELIEKAKKPILRMLEIN
ncbi:MAG: quinolinate synthase [Bacteroidetes bacterium GWE2_29_8]|nr:MAG: quinolinate synthase [Bacteroidetes bacterium GWE2_29_8]